MQKTQIAPSLLAADFGNLDSEITSLEAAGADILHLDIMDGHYVPNLSFGFPVIRTIRFLSKLPLDVHLMVPIRIFIFPFCWIWMCNGSAFIRKHFIIVTGLFRH